jgi:cell wall assembly regulator SMI1
MATTLLVRTSETKFRAVQTSRIHQSHSFRVFCTFDPHINKTMTLVQEFLDAHRTKLKDFADFMNPGASDDDIAAFEKSLGRSLPANYKELLKAHNGEKFVMAMAGFAFLSMEEVLQQWKWFGEPKSTEVQVPALFQDRMISPQLYDTARIPFAHDGSGQYLCFDYAPDVNGRAGQVIYLPCGEPEPASVIFRDFDHLLQFVITSLKSGKLAFTDDREDYDEDAQDNADVYFYKTWRDDWTDIAAEFNSTG